MRFEHLFRSRPVEPVLHALAAYQNSDGGYGQALEPDFRGPVSQPLLAMSALSILDEVGKLSASTIEPLLRHLTAVSAADGGLPNVLADAVDCPRAPWWQPAPAQL